MRRWLAAGGLGLVLSTPAAAQPPAPPAAPSDVGPVLPPIDPTPPPPGLYAPAAASFPIDLPTALRLAGADNPTVHLARARHQQALAQLDRARVGWLPNLSFGPTFFYHDGIDQNRRGDIFSVGRGNFGLIGGPTARYDLGDAFYQPLVARRLAEAAGSRARAANNDVLLDVALAYQDLLEAHALRAVSARTLFRAEQMLAAARAGEKAGVNKTAADVNRAATEVNLRRAEGVALHARVGSASARLARLLLLDPAAELVPAETTVAPVMLVSGDRPLEELIAAGLAARPEVAAADAEARAAGALARQARQAPLIPRVEAQFLGGGLSPWRDTRPNVFSEMRGQYNASAGLVWQLDALGAGNRAQVRGREAGQAAALYQVQEVRARVAAEVADAARAAAARYAALGPAEEAVREAQEMGRKFRAVALGPAGPKAPFDALEPLTAVQALNNARVEYVRQIAEFNRAQFRLLTAMGKPATVPEPANRP